jgi:hypothetical protein
MSALWCPCPYRVDGVVGAHNRLDLAAPSGCAPRRPVVLRLLPTQQSAHQQIVHAFMHQTIDDLPRQAQDQTHNSGNRPQPPAPTWSLAETFALKFVRSVVHVWFELGMQPSPSARQFSQSYAM